MLKNLPQRHGIQFLLQHWGRCGDTDEILPVQSHPAVQNVQSHPYNWNQELHPPADAMFKLITVGKKISYLRAEVDGNTEACHTPYMHLGSTRSLVSEGKEWSKVVDEK
jgi:hypothetical protein